MKAPKRFHKMGERGKSSKRDKKQLRKMKHEEPEPLPQEELITRPLITANNGRQYRIADDGSYRRVK